MNELQALPGVICRSNKGHDKGRHYIILKIQQNGCVLVADGEYRKTNSPKLKNIKHLENLSASKLKDKLVSGANVSDTDIKRAIKLYQVSANAQNDGECKCQKVT